MGVDEEFIKGLDEDSWRVWLARELREIRQDHADDMAEIRGLKKRVRHLEDEQLRREPFFKVAWCALLAIVGLMVETIWRTVRG